MDCGEVFPLSTLLTAQGYRRLRWQHHSVLIRPRLLIICLLLALLVGIVASCALPGGSVDIPLSGIWRLLWLPTQPGNEQHTILWDIRLPRILLAVLCGAMLGMAGAAMQALTRNGLADPGLIGVKQGASAGVLLLMIAFPGLALAWRPWAGLAGGVLAAGLVIAVARDMSRTRFILIGIGVSWTFSAAISLFITTADIRQVQMALVWMAGSLHSANWPMLTIASGWGSVGALILYATARAADVAQLGPALATGLGLRQRLLTAAQFAAPVMLTAVSVSCVGNLGFVGLMAPHISRLAIGGNQTALLTGSALFGALLVLVADSVGRLAFAPLQLPAGIVMSVLGVPFFLILLWQRRDRL